MKTLPLCDPLISNYPQHAFYLSIISDHRECQPWIYSNYTNLFLSDWKNDEIFLDFYVQTPEHHFNPWFKDSQRLHRDLILGSIPISSRLSRTRSTPGITYGPTWMSIIFLIRLRFAIIISDMRL